MAIDDVYEKYIEARRRNKPEWFDYWLEYLKLRNDAINIQRRG